MTLSQKSIDESIRPFYDSWEVLSQDISVCIAQRETECRQLILNAHGLYAELKSTLFKLFGEALLSPLNEQERLDFIKNSKSTHAAYRQLDQLFKELKKKIARQKLAFPVI